MNSSQFTSPTLLGGVKAHDAEAWRQLTEIYGPMVYGWLRRLGLKEQDSADVVQDVFQAVFTSIERFRKNQPSDRFRDWLYTITRRRFCDHLRKTVGRPAPVGGTDNCQRLDALSDPVIDDSAVLKPSDEADVLRRAMDLVQTEFAERTWQACYLTAVEERVPAVVAKELGMSVGAIYIARSRVLKRLREVLDGLI